MKLPGLEGRMAAEGLQAAIHPLNTPLDPYAGKLSHKGDYVAALPQLGWHHYFLHQHLNMEMAETARETSET